MVQQINENMIREAAYFLWEKAGRPDGSAEYFWMKACEQFFKPKKVEIKKPAPKKACKTKPAPKKVSAVKKPAPAVKKPVAIKKPTVKVVVRPLSSATKTGDKSVKTPFYGSRR